MQRAPDHTNKPTNDGSQKKGLLSVLNRFITPHVEAALPHNPDTLPIAHATVKKAAPPAYPHLPTSTYSTRVLPYPEPPPLHETEPHTFDMPTANFMAFNSTYTYNPDTTRQMMMASQPLQHVSFDTVDISHGHPAENTEDLPMDLSAQNDDGTGIDEDLKERIEMFDIAMPMGYRKDTLHEHLAMTPLHPDESNSYHKLIEKAKQHRMQIYPMPSHYITHNGNLRGFKCSVDLQAPVSCLPMHTAMFRGTALYEVPWEVSTYGVVDDGTMHLVHPVVLKLARNLHKTKDTLLKMLQEICGRPQDSLLQMKCAPNTEVADSESDDETAIYEVDCGESASDNIRRRTIYDRFALRDTESWQCDCPDQFGLYHAYVRNRRTLRREHKLFILVSGTPRILSNEIYNMVIDLEESTTVRDLLECEETTWGRRAASRNRAYFALEVANALRLDVHTLQDMYSSRDDAKILEPSSEVFENDIVKESDTGTRATFTNECIDTTSISNGVICHQHPTEGTWIFCGKQRSQCYSNAVSDFGGAFGSGELCGAFPSRTVDTTEWRFIEKNMDGEYKALNSESVPLSVQAGAERSATVPESLPQRKGDQKLRSNVFYFRLEDGTEISEDDVRVLQNASATHEQHKQCLGQVMYTSQVEKYMNEKYLKHIEAAMDWNRDYGLVQLIPILVGIGLK